MKGFTLIETVVYIALLGILMGGAVLTSYDLLESSSKSSGKTAVQEEGSFVQRKMEWALSGATAVTVGGSNCNQTLSVTKAGASNPIQFQLDAFSGAVQMREGGLGAYTPLTTSNVSVSCLKFASIAAISPGPSGIIATTTIQSLDFVVTKYLRK